MIIDVPRQTRDALGRTVTRVLRYEVEYVEAIGSYRWQLLPGQRAEEALRPLADLHIVAIGGGTGLPVVLRGLKQRLVEEGGNGKGFGSLTAIVTVADDGGSSGRIRQDFQTLPPGDLRNCLVALGDEESAFGRALQYRFQEDGALQGHSLGNLLFAALTRIGEDALGAIEVLREVLAVRGMVLPATAAHVNLIAELEDGAMIQGEQAIGRANGRIQRLRLDPPGVPAFPACLTALRRADAVVIGPGSLYTSLLAPMLVPGMIEAVRESRAVKILVGNLMTQPGETTGFTGLDHVRAFGDHFGGSLFDAVLINRAPIPAVVRSRYASEGAEPVAWDPASMEEHGLIPVAGDLLATDDKVRHDPRKLADLLTAVCTGLHQAR
jgi:uncharacterized cofD-like protein